MDFIADHFEAVVAVVGGVFGAAGTLVMMVYRRGVQFNILQKEIEEIKTEYDELKEQNRKDHETVKADQAKIWAKVSKIAEDVSYMRGQLESKKEKKDSC